MITIAIEIDHLVRNLNYQIYKYYKKEFNPTMDLDEIDTSLCPFENGCDFDSVKQKNNFLYIDYPFEIYGCAKEIEKNIQTYINNIISDYDEDVKIVYYSICEDDNLSIQSTLYFLSKIACRVKEFHFIQDYKEAWDLGDVIVTSTPDFFYNPQEGKKVIRIDRPHNVGTDNNTNTVIKEYPNLSDFTKDIDNVLEILNKEKES